MGVFQLVKPQPLHARIGSPRHPQARGRAIGMGVDGCRVVGRVFAKCGISEIFLPRGTSLNHDERNFSRFRNRV